MPSRTSLQTGILLFLAAVCLVMAGIIYDELVAPMDETDAGGAAPATRTLTPAHEPATGFSFPPLESFSAVTDRPLFSPTRRPSPQGSDDSLGSWSSLVLAGIIIAPQSREALIVHGKPQVMAHVQEGQTIEGWVVTSILPDHIVLSGGGSDHELRLLDKPKPAAGPGPVPAPTVPRRPFTPP